MIIAERQSAFRRCVMSSPRLRFNFNFHFVFISLPALAINAPREKREICLFYGAQDTRLPSPEWLFGIKSWPSERVAHSQEQAWSERLAIRGAESQEQEKRIQTGRKIVKSKAEEGWNLKSGVWILLGSFKGESAYKIQLNFRKNGLKSEQGLTQLQLTPDPESEKSIIRVVCVHNNPWVRVQFSAP